MSDEFNCPALNMLKRARENVRVCVFIFSKEKSIIKNHFINNNTRVKRVVESDFT